MSELSVSVALCTYNGARYIGEQLRSIIRQDRAPAEIVVGDDGSGDGTLDLVRAVAEEEGYSSLRILPPGRRLGVTRNFERTIASTTGDLIALSDQDDVWHTGRLRAIVRHFDDDPALALVHTDADLVDDGGRSLDRTLFESLEVSDQELAGERGGRAFEVLLRRNLATGATIVFRRGVLAVAEPFVAPWVHDEWLALLAAATGSVGVIEEPTIDYRQHGSNQIGVQAPTLRRKIGRVLEPRADRNRLLADRFRGLSTRLEELGDRVPEDYRRLADEKARFETQRAEMPRNRARRLLPVLRLARTGAYARFASQGTTDILRDLLQPA